MGTLLKAATRLLKSSDFHEIDIFLAQCALWGMSQLLMAMVYVAILWKYPALLPFGCLLFTLEYGMRLTLQLVTRHGLVSKGPVVTLRGAPGGLGDWVLTPLGALLFWMSLSTDEKYIHP